MVRLFAMLVGLTLATVVSATARSADGSAAAVRRAPNPQPSRRMGTTKRTAASNKAVPIAQRQQQVVGGPAGGKDYSSFLCPDASMACPVPAPGSDRAGLTEVDLQDISTWFLTGFECIDPAEELGSCGGCLSLGQGQDCTAIAHTRDVSCERGSCVVQRCKEGFAVGLDRKSCVKPASTTTTTASGGGGRR